MGAAHLIKIFLVAKKRGQDGGAKLGSERQAATCPRPGHAGQSLGPATGSGGALAAGRASESRAPAPPGGRAASLQAQPRPARPAHPRRAPRAVEVPASPPSAFRNSARGLGLQGFENEPPAPCALSSGALAADSGSAGHRGPFFFFSCFAAFQDFLFRVALRHGQGCQHSRFGIEPSDSANTIEGKPPFARAPRLLRPGAKSGWQGQVAHKLCLWVSIWRHPCAEAAEISATQQPGLDCSSIPSSNGALTHPDPSYSIRWMGGAGIMQTCARKPSYITARVLIFQQTCSIRIHSLGRGSYSFGDNPPPSKCGGADIVIWGGSVRNVSSYTLILQRSSGSALALANPPVNSISLHSKGLGVLHSWEERLELWQNPPPPPNS
ncbi:uncharacterized protein LOC110255736 [Sus scrofa]|uniref:uncharacterized protein LOC110255736 n=1 Tax=Sus scrofa TaxID=9823 RepID=UPI000A2B7A56|nr:uncharacterized protein LOC110255736 [Sus scrofa]